MTNTQPPKNYRVSIKALIADDQGRLLMIQERGTHWSIPGGGLEHGEDICEALKREIQEELGVVVTSISDQPRFVWTKEHSKDFWCLMLCYEVDVDSHDFALEAGIQSARFFTATELKNLDFDPAEAPIADYYAGR